MGNFKEELNAISEYMKVKFSAERIGIKKNVFDDGYDMKHYKIVLKYSGRQYTFDYYMGMGLDIKPNIDDVVVVLFQDVQSVDENTLEQFSREFGYESEKGKKIYNGIQRQKRNLMRLFGDNYEIIKDYVINQLGVTDYELDCE